VLAYLARYTHRVAISNSRLVGLDERSPRRAVFAHYDERCFLPIHVYDTATSRPVAVLLRPGKTPSGVEVRGHLRRLVRRIRRHWPQTRIAIRGDGHYGRPEVMEWCDENGVDFIFGLPGNAVLDRAVNEIADDIRTRRALDEKPYLRGFAETSYRAKSWKTDRRACARIEATTKGLDIRFVVTSIETGSAEHIYETPLLRPGPGRKPDQIAQGTARFGPHQLPQPARQPDAAYPTYRRLLADAHRPRRHPQGTRARHRRVRHHPPAALEARRAGYRDGVARPARLCRSLPRRDLDPPCRGGADADRAISDGADIAPVTCSENLQHLPQ
jgi:hypothetical protein